MADSDEEFGDDMGLGVDDPPQSQNQQQKKANAKPEREDVRLAYLEKSKDFWKKQKEELNEVDFKSIKPALPLARIKKIMKSDEDVRMISAEAPVLFAKACELFILDLTMRAWAHTDQDKRRTLTRNDVAQAIAGDEMFDFLVDVVPIQHDSRDTDTEELLQTFERATKRNKNSSSSSSSSIDQRHSSSFSSEQIYSESASNNFDTSLPPLKPSNSLQSGSLVPRSSGHSSSLHLSDPPSDS